MRPAEEVRTFSQEQMHLLESCANQIALALEVDRLHEQNQPPVSATDDDHMRLVFSKAVSHDLRTPLVAVMGAASTLMEMGNELDKQHIRKLANEIYHESEQLSRLINNLLQMTYLEAETVKLQIAPHFLQESIEVVLENLSKKIGRREININLPKNLPEILYDDALIQDVFINLIENALKFTPPESPIEISAIIENNRVVVSVEDNGPGIVFDEVNKLFENIIVDAC